MTSAVCLSHKNVKINPILIRTISKFPISHCVQFRNISGGCKPRREQFVLFVNFMRKTASYIQSSLKERATAVIQIYARQCEFVIAQRVRRGHQMFNLYSRLWEEKALKAILQGFKQQLFRRGPCLTVGAGLLKYNWDKEKILDHDIISHAEELMYIEKLKMETLICKKCAKRLVIDKKLPDIEYCVCTDSRPVYDTLFEGCLWMPFIERKDLLVWRQEHDTKKGLYAYKMYGRYDDVSASDFFNVQIDTDFRHTWDTSTASIKVLESDAESHSEIIYWEMLWPRFFANRDYVFNRRYMINKQKNVIVIVNQGTNHPTCPPVAGNHRVNDYWSVMVIKPYHREFTKPGIEFVLTYFDNPGITIPSAVSTWVAMSGLPSFLSNLRDASRTLRLHRMNMADSNTSIDIDTGTISQANGIEPCQKLFFEKLQQNTRANFA